MKFGENEIENLTIEVFDTLGWLYEHGLSIAPEAEKSERESFEQVMLLPKMMSREVRVREDQINENNH